MHNCVRGAFPVSYCNVAVRNVCNETKTPERCSVTVNLEEPKQPNKKCGVCDFYTPCSRGGYCNVHKCMTFANSHCSSYK